MRLVATKWYALFILILQAQFIYDKILVVGTNN